MLRLATVALLVLASPTSAATRLDSPDEQALKSFRLTSDNVRKAAAVERRLAAEAVKDPSLAGALARKGGRHETLAAKTKALEADPRVAAALRSESIGAREYVMVQITAAEVRVVEALKARGLNLGAADLAEALNPANVAFVETHRKEMDDLCRSQQELQAATGQAGQAQQCPAGERE